MKRFVFISALIELLAGAIMFFAPQLVPDLAQGTSSHMAMARMYFLYGVILIMNN